MKNLRELRLKKGCSQNQLAQFMQVGNSTVFRWEQGICSPTLFQFLKLCKVLNCTPAQLLGDMDIGTIPVFNTDFTIAGSVAVTGDMSACWCCFGIVVPSALSARINCGDICFFSFGSTPETERVVFASTDNCNGNLFIFKEYDEEMQIIAVCQFMHSRI